MIELYPSDIDNYTKAAVDRYLANGALPPRLILGIPRGGMPVAYKVAWEFARRFPEMPDPVVGRAPETGIPTADNVLIVDDIVDSGKTMLPYAHLPTMSLISKSKIPSLPKYWGIGIEATEWVRFPWDEKSGTPEEAVIRILEFLGRDPNEPSLLETPRRYLSWLSEFSMNQPDPEITTFEGIKYDQMIVVKDIPFISLCEHHLLPFSGTAAVAYIPSQSSTKVIGISKLARIVMYYAKRLQVQERLTEEILATIVGATQSKHAAVVIKAEHSCMSWRGPKAQGALTITSALSGDFLTDPKTREEFLRLSGV